jgi:sugar lactone lactonase YvrE
VAVDGNGNVYVTVGLQVVEVPWTGSGYGAQTTVGNGFAEPFGVAVDAGGNLYVADYANGAVKIDLADAPTLTFAATNVGTTSSDSPQTVTIENIGNETLTFTAPPSYPASFPENGSAADLCASNTSLAEGSSCNVSVNFVPIAGGSNAGGLVLTDNALNGTPAIQSIPLTGVGFAATQLAFVTAPVSNILTGGNAGAAITVEEENSMGTLVSSASDTIILAVTGPGGYFQLYSATASGGIATFNLSAVPLTAAGSYTYAASGSSLTSAVATETVVAPALNFGSSTGVGSSTPAQTVTLYIANSGTLNQIQVLTEGAPNLDFTQASGGTCATGTIYTAGQTCTVNVMFTPLYAGTRLGAVLLTDSNGNALGTAYLSGTGTGAQIAFGPGVRSTMGIGANYPQASPQGPRSVAVDGSGNVYIADSNNGRVLKAPLADLACSTPGDCTTVGTGLQGPSGVAVDGSGNVYIADPGIGQVVQVPWTGSGYGAQTVVGSFVQPSGVAVDGNGNVYVAASGSSQVFEIAWTGSGYGVQTALASGGGLSTPLNGPTGVAVDGSGNVYIADPNNARVIQVPPTDLACSTAGDCLTVGSGLIGPNGVAVDGNGNVYIADLSLAQVVKVPWTGSGYGAQTAASGFGGPYGVAVDGSGNIYVADLINSDTLKVDLADAPSLTFASTNVSSTSSDSPQIVTLENIGNQPLDFSGQTISTNWQQVATGGTDCSASSQIAQGTTCNLAISFMPQTAGSPLTGGVALTDNTLNQANPTQTIALSGIALQQSQTISFTLLGPVTYGIGPITLAATASSGLTPTFSVVSGPGSISGNTLSITGAGTIVVAANQTGNATYLAAPQVTQTLMVNMAAPTVNWTPVPTISYGTALSFLSNVTATYNSQTIPGVFTYTAQSAAGGAAPVTASTTLAAGTYTLTASFAPADAVDYAPATASAQIVVTDDALALTVNNAARVYGTPNPTFTGNVAGAANGDSFTESFTTTATIGSNVGSYPIVPTVTGTNLPNYAVTAQNGTLTITQAASAVTLVSSALTSSPNTSVTFTATVASATTGTPTGSVQFFDGATQLGAGTLNTQGVASLTVATLATGAHTISADYSGDINFTQSVSPALTQTVTVPPDYSLAANPTALTIEPGQTGTITFTVTPVGGYTGTVNFSCAGLPAGASCSFSPASVSLDGSDTLQTTQLSIVTLGPNHGTVSMNRRGDISRSDPVRASLFLLPGILLGGFLTWRRNKLAGTLKGTLVVLILISAIGGLAGCGGSSSPSVKPGTSTVTVTATANAAGNGSSESQTATFTLTIAQ